MTWRERSSAWMPLAWPSAVPTAALLKEPMIRCDPLWRIQLADHSVLSPVSKTKTASRLARSPTARATACGWMTSLLRVGSACLSSISSHLRRSLVTRSRNFVSLLAASRPGSSLRGGRTRRPPSEHLRPFVDLDNDAFVRQEFRIRIIGAEHQQQLAAHDRIVDGLGADHADAAHPMRVIVGHDILALDRMDQRRLEAIRKRAQVLRSAVAAGSAHDDDAVGRVQPAGD